MEGLEGMLSLCFQGSKDPVLRGQSADSSHDTRAMRPMPGIFPDNANANSNANAKRATAAESRIENFDRMRRPLIFMPNFK